MPALAGVATFAASRGWATAAAAFTPAAAPRAIQGAPAFLLNLSFLSDQVVDAPIQAKAGDFLGVLIGGWYRAEAEPSRGVVDEAAHLSHDLPAL
ncbi:hypothetical protein TX25_24175 [Pseudomonas lactis]|nr:hypothetical protein TX25_24175 [Pseudomonas lactis]